MKIIIVFAVIASSFTCLYIQGYEAFVCQPVVDLVGEPLQKSPTERSKDVAKRYAQLSPEAGCRVHQLIFNERVDVLEERGAEVRVAIKNAYYLLDNNQEPQIVYWALKKSFMPLSYMKDRFHITSDSIIPPAISFHDEASLGLSKNIVTLSRSWYDPASALVFSAGTRFVQQPTLSMQKSVAVTFFNNKKNKIMTGYIPTDYVINHTVLTSEQRANTFINILQQWARLPDPIKYVWGGCSIMHDISALPTDYKPNYGIDCTGLIMRAAQACGIPYFFKNSTTVIQCLRPLTAHEKIENGDIIWVKGHVMVVSDVKKNMLIEARGYQHGFGKVHELALRDVFLNMPSFNDLMNAFHTHTTVKRLDATKSPTGPLLEVKIFKLASIWQKK